MNTILWIIQIILCIKFITTAYSHGLQKNNANMQDSISVFGDKSKIVHKFISVIVFIGAVAILFPAILEMNNSITISAAILLSVMMIVSIIFHIRSRNNPLLIADAILFLLILFIAYGRWKLFPL
jgi:hypothetical protein